MLSGEIYRMTIEYKDSKRISALSSDVVNTPTYEDDFSTDTLGANTTDATYIDWDGSGAIDLIAPVSVATGGGDSGWFDLTTVSDSVNVVRFSLDTSAITVGITPQMWIGLSSIGTGDSTTTNDWFGMYMQASAGNPIIIAGHANGIGCNNATSDSTFTKTLAVEKIWVEIIRTSTTAFTLNIFSDEYVTLTESKTGVTTSVTSTTNFRMITRNSSGTASGWTLKLGDLKFYNGVSSLTNKPTNVETNSILVEKDTGRRYWFDDSFDKTGLKAYYKFNETSPSDIVNQAGTVGSVDGLGTGADIQITGATYGATGKIGDALSFDGTNDFGQIGTSLSQFNFLHSTTAKWTICFWMKLNATSRGTFDRIFNTTVSSGSAGINIYINDLSSTQKMGFVIHNNVSGQGVTDWVSTADNYIPDNTTTWYFYSMTYDQSLGSDNLKVKRDNANLETKTKTANSPYNGNSTYAMFLDRLPSGSGNFPANVIDEFSVWNRVLTDAEITTIYNSGTGKTLDTAKGATWTMTPTFQDDFSTDNWVNMSSRINVNTTTEKLDFAMYR
jgi:hypothetical protein